MADRRSAWFSRLTWGFVALGVVLRIGRYALNFPLWWDEAFVGVNFLKRGYLDLLRPLDYGQVCPLLFLWVELTVVKLFGFSEWTLRLFPMVCGVGSVFLFRHVSGRIMSGLPQLLAVAIFAVAFYPIRHAADVKPYASDLLAALVLMALAFEWLRTSRIAKTFEAGVALDWKQQAGRLLHNQKPSLTDPCGAGVSPAFHPPAGGLSDSQKPSFWLWILAAAGPIAVSLSYPAIFVAGGIGLALLPSVWKTHQATNRVALATFGLATLATFFALFATVTQSQAGATLPAMASEWADSFPPWQNPWKLAVWLISTHTGDLFSYPFGAFRGASTFTFALVALAAVVLYRSHQKTAMAVCLLPFAMGLLAAAMHRYPYGGSAHGGSSRFMQYLAPSICLLAGFGASVALDWIGSQERKARVVRLGLMGLAVAGIAPVLLDFSHPYRAIQAQKSREFARQFWPSLTQDARVQCLRWDVGISPWESIHLNVAVDLCNQAIYSPQRVSPGKTSDAFRERFVLSNAQPEDEARLKAWQGLMKNHHALANERTIVVDVGEPRGRKAEERYRVFEFLPKAEVTANRHESFVSSP